MSKIINHTTEDGVQTFELIKQNQSKYKTWFAVPSKKVSEYLKSFIKGGYFLIPNEMGKKGFYVLGENNNIVAMSCLVSTKGIYSFQVLKEIYEGEA
tara:strand:+ start:601 stop:891 length:291 start_codon:yes stop_codon:yes gene_type:complete